MGDYFWRMSTIDNDGTDLLLAKPATVRRRVAVALAPAATSASSPGAELTVARAATGQARPAEDDRERGPAARRRPRPARASAASTGTSAGGRTASTPTRRPGRKYLTALLRLPHDWSVRNGAARLSPRDLRLFRRQRRRRTGG